MAFSQVIQEQPESPNPLGQAIERSAGTIGESMVRGADYKRQQSDKLVTMTMQFLPQLMDNPQMLKQFTGHPDFGPILAAFQKSGLGNVWSRDAATGSYKVNVPKARPTTLEGMFIDEIYKDPKLTAPGANLLPTIISGMQASSMNPYARAIATAEGDDAVVTDEEATASQKAEDDAVKYGSPFQRGAVESLRGSPYEGTETAETGGFLGFGKKKGPKYKNALEAALGDKSLDTKVREQYRSAVASRKKSRTGNVISQS